MRPTTRDFTFFRLPLPRSLARATTTSKTQLGKEFGNLSEKSAFAWTQAVQHSMEYWHNLRKQVSGTPGPPQKYAPRLSSSLLLLSMLDWMSREHSWQRLLCNKIHDDTEEDLSENVDKDSNEDFDGLDDGLNNQTKRTTRMRTISPLVERSHLGLPIVLTLTWIRHIGS